MQEKKLNMKDNSKQAEVVEKGLVIEFVLARLTPFAS